MDQLRHFNAKNETIRCETIDAGWPCMVKSGEI